MGIALPFLDAFGGNLTSLGMMACHTESVEVCRCVGAVDCENFVC